MSMTHINGKTVTFSNILNKIEVAGEFEVNFELGIRMVLVTRNSERKISLTPFDGINSPQRELKFVFADSPEPKIPFGY